MLAVANVSSWFTLRIARLGARRRGKRRASELLRENLSAPQRAEYDQNGFFEVIGGTSGKRYRIRRGIQMNVEELNVDGRLVRSLCFVPRGHLPIGDVMLAQKIALELMEIEALRVARSSPFAHYVPPE